MIYLIGLNDSENQLEIDGIRVDFNPINKEKSGSMEEWLDKNYNYDKYKEQKDSFWKKLCLACIKTENKNLVLEENSNKIHYLILTDEAKEKTNQGKDINIDNYREFLDPNFEEMNDEIFTSWEGLFDEHINDQIYYDIKDLGLYDENGKWNFYIEKKDLETLGYENLEIKSEEEEEDCL